MTTETLAEALRTRRRRLGLTQEGLARRLGLNRTTIVRYERGGLIPNPEQLELALAQLERERAEGAQW